jgi:4-diphosphocytidyl-2-C-methyl-D-erythritol kinase
MVRALKEGSRDGVLAAVHNDFEATVFERYPRLVRVREALLGGGAEAAFLTGSGSTVVGIAHNVRHAHALRELMRHEEGVRKVLCCRTLATDETI